MENLWSTKEKQVSIQPSSQPLEPLLVLELSPERIGPWGQVWRCGFGQLPNPLWALMSSFINGDVSASFQERVRLKCNTGLNLLFSLSHSLSRSFLGPPELQISDPGSSGEHHH